MTWSEGLEGPALAIAGSDALRLRVMAGPGTGKSFAMKRRVARLLEEGQTPDRILAVTFTRNAAFALRDDLYGLGAPGAADIRAGTLHSYCFGLLNKGHVFEFLSRVPRPIITFTSSGVLRYEGSALLHDVIGGPTGGRRDCTKRIRAFEAAWARLQSDMPGWPTDPHDEEFHRRLLRWLRFHEAILIGELVPETLRFLRANPTTPELSAFDHVIVDEYQDLNRAEQTLLDLIAGVAANAIVGDADQSIYSFRHAHPDGIVDFSDGHPGTIDQDLVECRRCPKRVVTIADHLIRHNHPPDSMPRLAPMASNPEGIVHIVQWQSLRQEAEGLAEYIQWLVSSSDYAVGDVLVLTPRRLLGYAVRDELAAREIMAHSFYHEEALEAHSAQRGLTLLRLLATPEDRVSLRWWLSQGSPSGNAGEYSRLRDHCIHSGDSPRRALERLVSGDIQIRRTTRIQRAFRELTALLDELEEEDLQQLVNQVLPNDDEGCSALRETAEMVIPAVDSLEEMFETLVTSVSQPEMPDEGDFVRVMSLHKSKGLSSKVVIIAGAIHGLIPFYNRDETEGDQVLTLEEQRRLFYVALTRTREVLVISSAARIARDLAHKIGAVVPYGRGAQAPTIASPFLGELGPAAPPSKAGSGWRESGWV